MNNEIGRILEKDVLMVWKGLRLGKTMAKMPNCSILFFLQIPRARTMRSSLGLPVVFFFATVTSMNISKLMWLWLNVICCSEDIVAPDDCGETWTTCPNDTPGTQCCQPDWSCCKVPTLNTYQCCPYTHVSMSSLLIPPSPHPVTKNKHPM